MEKLRAQTEARRATIASATKRAVEAERISVSLQSALREKTKLALELQKRLELTRQSKQLSKELLVALQKLDEAKKKLSLVSSKSDALESRLEAARGAADDFEAKYQISKKKYNELIVELEHLDIN